ncbi:TRAP transporter large permease [Inquilinus sp. OTU3971]|uniref:TRAP transporter large permease n=1 Tax=Inquilinus sp. OTU3971 TaxID=3043855 RepID=UPI00313DCC01
MSPLALGATAVFGIAAASGIGIPIGMSIALVAIAGMLLTAGYPYVAVTLQTLPYATAADYTFIVVPMFVLMGNIAAAAGIIEALFEAAHKWLSRMRGGLYVSTILASAGFAAVSGSTVVNAAVFTRLALPQMIRLGYDRAVSSGCIAAAGTFAVMIPPSLAFVLYGIMTGESVGRLFIAGIIPGLLTAAIYLALVPAMVRIAPNWAPPPTERYTLTEKMRSLRPLWAIALLVGVVLGGIYTGLFPPSAAGAIGALGALLIALARRRMTAAVFWDCVARSATMASSLFLIIIAGFLFSRFMVTSGFVPALVDWIGSSGMGPTEFLAFMVVFYFVLGMFIDGASMAVITLPFMYPVAKSLGIDPVWFGVLFVKLVEIGAITPPVGINLFAVVSASEGQMKLTDAVRGIWPFVLVEIGILGLLIAFPALSTWLPATM